MARIVPSKPARAAVNAGLVVGRVLDYGCGRGRDVTLFADRKEVDMVTGYDPGHEEWAWPPNGKYDFVQCGFVLNVIERPSERVQVLRTIKGHLTPDGRAMVSVRSPEDIAKHAPGEVFGDGVKTGKGTFQRGFTRDELVTLARRAGLRVLSNERFNVRLPKRVTWIVVAR